MNERERRHAERHEETFPVLVTTSAPVEIEGQSLNVSSSGLFLTAHGQTKVKAARRRWAVENSHVYTPRGAIMPPCKPVTGLIRVSGPPPMRG